jgi:hypothetical protein
MKLYLTDFLNRTFPGENAKNRDFSGKEKMKAAAIYHVRVKHRAARSKPAFCSRDLYL